jgi:hypothetical protein
MRNKSITIWLMVSVLVISAGQGFGYTEFKDGGTHNINYTINDSIRVDYQAPSMQTTVNLLNGGNTPSSFSLEGYNDSRINISGGSLGNDLWAYGNCQVTISSGSISGDLFARSSSQVTMTEGSVGGVFYSDGSSFVNWYGGAIGRRLTLIDTATLTIYGSNFVVNGIPFGCGEIKSISGGYYTDEPLRTLTGTLANGDIIDHQFQIGNDAKIVIVPEPATLLLLGLGAVVARRIRLKIYGFS